MKKIVIDCPTCFIVKIKDSSSPTFLSVGGSFASWETHQIALFEPPNPNATGFFLRTMLLGETMFLVPEGNHPGAAIIVGANPGDGRWFFDDDTFRWVDGNAEYHLGVNGSLAVLSQTAVLVEVKWNSD